MKLRLGSKTLNTPTLLEQGLFTGKINDIYEGDKVRIRTEFLDTVIFDVTIENEGITQQKQKKMILSNKSGSELARLLASFDYLKAEDGSFDLLDLVGQECDINIVHNTSTQGNIFANIDTIRSLDSNQKGGAC